MGSDGSGVTPGHSFCVAECNLTTVNQHIITGLQDAAVSLAAALTRGLVLIARSWGVGLAVYAWATAAMKYVY